MKMTQECRIFLDEHFDLEKYRSCNDFDLSDWYSQFLYRSEALNARSHCNINALFAAPLQQVQEIHDPRKVKQTAPIKDWIASDYFCANITIRNNLKSISDEFHKAKEWMSKFLVVYQDSDLDNNHLASQFIESVPNQYLNSSTEVFQQSVKDCRPKMDPDITVNLFHSDEVLKEQFKDWLKNKRTILGECENLGKSRNQFGDKDLQKWTRSKILQFLDLNTAVGHFKCEITQAELVPYLFKDEIEKGIASDFVDRIRKTIKPEARRMLDPNILVSLRLATQT